jgi:hypothetical protein
MNLAELVAKHGPLTGRLEQIRRPQQAEVVAAAVKYGFIDTCNALQVSVFELEHTMAAHGCKRCEECGDMTPDGELEGDALGNPTPTCSVCGSLRTA